MLEKQVMTLPKIGNNVLACILFFIIVKSSIVIARLKSKIFARIGIKRYLTACLEICIKVKDEMLFDGKLEKNFVDQDLRDAVHVDYRGIDVEEDKI